ncbi:MAG: type VI secretion system baseplate subunit TssF, partial [Gemmataceae bacterium]
SADPHIERMIEAFALLSGRIRQKLDDEFPELSDALLHVLYPHYLAPIPSLAVVQFVADPARTPLKDGFTIPRHSRLRTRPVNDLPCRYRTIYPVTLWPITLTQARVLPPPFPEDFRPPPGTAAALRLRFEGQAGAKFSDLAIERLCLHLAGDGQLVSTVYEALCNGVNGAMLRTPEGDARKNVPLKVDDLIRPLGFENDENLLEYPPHSLPGYRLLSEFFAYPAKFWFVDLGGFQEAKRAGFTKSLELVLYLNRTSPLLEQGVDASLFRFGCTPVVNLFEQIAEPINLNQTRFEYRVVPLVSQPDGMEVYSILEVSSTDPASGRTTLYQPFYSFKHRADRDEPRAFWYATRRPSGREGDRGTEVYLNLVDLDFNPHLPSTPTLVVRTLCTNRDLAGVLQRAGEGLYFELEAVAPLAGLRTIRTPTLPLRPARQRGAFWKLISHLNLNHLSLSEEGDGRFALQEILRLYDFADPESGQQLAEINRQMIEGLLDLRSRRVVGRVADATASGFCRGIEVSVTLDEERYVGTGVYLFASVLERFLGLYATINSFTQLVARTRQGEGVLRRWPPRAGVQTLL